MSSNQNNDIAISVENLSKCYQIYDKPRDRLKQMVLPKLQRLVGQVPKAYHREFWALKNVSFEVRKGETVGIIGRNGSGKSTLLQMICGTLNPTSGSIQTKGRVAALLELGSGFNPEFTGRENVYLNGAVLGLSQDEINVRFDEIADFAEIGDFIEQPVKTYSSGMMVRLAFAVAVSIDPDILIVDEALAVGDIRFQAKCFSRIQKLHELGTTILFVSHSSDQIIKLCNQAILVDRGQLVMVGLPKDISNKYMDLLYGQQQVVTSGEDRFSCSHNKLSTTDNLVDVPEHFSLEIVDEYANTPGWNPNEYRWGDGDASILNFKIIDKRKCHTVELYSHEEYVIAMKVLLKKHINNIVFGFYIKTIDGLLITGSNSRDYPDKQQAPLTISSELSLFEVTFKLCPRFASGKYMISLGVAEDVAGELVPIDRRYDSILIHVINCDPYFGLVGLDSRCYVKRIS